MQLEKLSELYRKNNLDEKAREHALEFLIELNRNISVDLDMASIDKLDRLIEHLVFEQKNSVDHFVIMMRYFKAIKRDDLYIHLTRYTGMLDVIDNIVNRLKITVGEQKAKEILFDFEIPYLGVSPYKLPEYSSLLMKLLEQNLDEKTVIKVVTGNNHNVRKESMLPEKIEYENSKNLETYLKERHQRKVQTLKEHYEQDKVWFEQKITKEVVDFVAGNQEILSAVLKDEKLYITKIPYEPDQYLQANNLKEKQYYGCHCAFAREAVKNGKPHISEKFCYCSAGFAKFPFEVILDQKLNITCLETILGGSDICRFEIDLKDVKYKK